MKLFSLLLGAIILAAGISDSFAAEKIRDIIPLRILASEKPDTIDVRDLFHSSSYNLKFKKHPAISVEFLKDKGLLVLKTGKTFEGYSVIEFSSGSQNYMFPVFCKLRKSVHFKFKVDGQPKRVNLFGNFNNWNRAEIPMADADGDGVYEVDYMVEPGIYQYKFYVDGKEFSDPENPERIPSGVGDFNSIIKISESYSTVSYLHLISNTETKKGITLKFKYERGEVKDALKRSDIIALLNNSALPAGSIKINGDEITLILGKSKGEQLVRIAINQKGLSTNMQSILLKDSKALNNSDYTWHDAIIYSIITDRFEDGDPGINKPAVHDSIFIQANYQGGDFQGIINKFNEGYFDKLGINTIWISPVYDNPSVAFKEYPAPHRWFSGYHGYWPISDTSVEENFGDMQKLKELIATAHKHEVKVLLDYVSNHTHKDHYYFKNNPKWYGTLDLPDGRKNLRLWDEYRLTTWFEPYLPSFDYEGSEDALEAMTDNAVWWLKETGADGFRHDAVKHVPNKFWRRLTQKIKERIEIPENRKVYQIGESFGGYDLISSYVNNGQLSSQFNFNLYDTAIPTFVTDNGSFANLDFEMKKTFSIYSNLHLMGNLMDSHDKVRFLAMADGDIPNAEYSDAELGWHKPPVVDNPASYDLMKLYITYMLTIPGVPVVYYGDEIGMTGASDPDNRRMMKFGSELKPVELKLYDEVSSIINLRKNTPALRYGDFYTVSVSKDQYAYIRSYLNERVLVVLNKAKSESEVTLEIPAVYGITGAVDMMSAEEVSTEGGKMNVKLPVYGWKVFKLK